MRCPYLFVGSNPLYDFDMDMKPRFLERILFLLVLILVVGIPLIFSPQITKNVFEISKLTFMRVFCLLGLGVWVMRMVWGRGRGNEKRDERGRGLGTLLSWWRGLGMDKIYDVWRGCATSLSFVDVLVFVWLLVCVLAACFSLNPLTSFLGFYGRWQGVVTLLNYGVLYFLVRWVVSLDLVLWRGWKPLHLLAGGIVFSAVLVAAYAIYQALGGPDIAGLTKQGGQAVFATVNLNIHFSIYLGMVLLFILGLLQSIDKKMGRWLLLLAFGFVFVAFQFGFSRGAALGLYFVLPFLFLLAPLNPRAFESTPLNPPTVGGDNAGVRDLLLTLLFAGGIWLVLVYNFLGVSFLFRILFVSAGCAVLALIYYFSFAYKPVQIICRIMILFLGLLLQFSSIYWICLVLYFLFVFLLLKLKGLSWSKQGLPLVLAGLILLGFQLWFMLSPGLSPAESLVKGKVSSLQSGLGMDSLRVTYLKTAWPWIKQYPLLGSGPDTIFLAYPQFRLEYSDTLIDSEYSSGTFSLHNELIDLLVATGVLGLLAYLSLILAVFCFLLRSARLKNDGLLAGIICAMGVYLLATQTSFGVITTRSLFFVLMGLGVGANFLNFRPASTLTMGMRPPPNPPLSGGAVRMARFGRALLWKSIASVLVWLLVVAGIYYSVQLWNADRYAYRGWLAGQFGYYQVGVANLQKAVAINPNEAYYYFELGETWRKGESALVSLREKQYALAKASEAYLQARNLCPTIPGVFVEQALGWARQAELAESAPERILIERQIQRFLQQVLASDPHNLKLRKQVFSLTP